MSLADRHPSPPMPPLRARLRPDAARLYPAISPRIWYSAQDPHDLDGGIWLLAPSLGDPKLNPGRQYVSLHHLIVDSREE